MGAGKNGDGGGERPGPRGGAAGDEAGGGAAAAAASIPDARLPPRKRFVRAALSPPPAGTAGRARGAVSELRPVSAVEPALSPADFQLDEQEYREEAGRLAEAGWRCVDCGTGATERFYRRPGRTCGYRCRRCYDAWILRKRSRPAGWKAPPARAAAGRGRSRATELAEARAAEHRERAASLARLGHRCRTCGTGETTRFYGGRGVFREYWCAACHAARARERHEAARRWSGRPENA